MKTIQAYLDQRRDILKQMDSIQTMERGKLCEQHVERGGVGSGRRKGPYYKQQTWEKGKNATRYIKAEEVPALKQAMAGYAQFQRLAEDYVDVTVEMTRQKGVASKKNCRTSSKTAHGKSTQP